MSHSATAINDRHTSHRNGFNVSCLEFIRKTIGLQIRLTDNCHVWDAMLEAYHNLHLKPKLITKLKEALRVIWDSLPQELINKAVKSFTLQLKRCTKAGSEQFEHSNWLPDIRQSVHCVVTVMMFCCVLAQTFFSMRKSLSAHSIISITSSYLKIIRFCLAVKCW